MWYGVFIFLGNIQGVTMQQEKGREEKNEHDLILFFFLHRDMYAHSNTQAFIQNIKPRVPCIQTLVALAFSVSRSL